MSFLTLSSGKAIFSQGFTRTHDAKRLKLKNVN